MEALFETNTTFTSNLNGIPNLYPISHQKKQKINKRVHLCSSRWNPEKLISEVYIALLLISASDGKLS
jgi:hypothetical protein